MKVAVCLAGNLRQFNQAIVSWKRDVLDKYDCDVFLNTWDFVGKKTDKAVDAHYLKYHGYDYFDTITYSVEQLKEYGVTEVEIERYYPEFYNRFFQETMLMEYSKILTYGIDPGRDHLRAQWQQAYISFISMWYKRWRCFEQMRLYSLRNAIEYDYVILSRPDYSLNVDIASLPNDSLLVPALNSRDELHDVYAIGTIDSIREYAGLYPRFARLSFDWKIGSEAMYNTLVLERYLQEIHLPYTLVHSDNPYGISYTHYND